LSLFLLFLAKPFCFLAGKKLHTLRACDCFGFYRLLNLFSREYLLLYLFLFLFL